MAIPFNLAGKNISRKKERVNSLYRFDSIAENHYSKFNRVMGIMEVSSPNRLLQ